MRVSTELLSLVPTLKTAPLQAFARLHTLAGKGVVDDADLGRPRDAEAATRLRDLAATLNAPTDAPALVVAAVAHADIATAAPFVSHNGIVARAVQRLLLVARGVDPTSVTVPEAGHLALRREGAHLLGEVDELVRRVAHRRDDDHDVVPGPLRLRDALGHPLDALGVRYRRTAVLLHDKCHVLAPSVAGLRLSQRPAGCLWVAR